MRNLLSVLVLLFSVQFAYAIPGNQPSENVGVGNFSTLTTSSTTYGLIAARNANRNLLVLQNTGLSTINLKFGASTVGAVMQLSAGTIFSPSPPLVDAIYAESVTGAPTLMIIEGLK